MTNIKKDITRIGDIYGDLTAGIMALMTENETGDLLTLRKSQLLGSLASLKRLIERHNPEEAPVATLKPAPARARGCVRPLRTTQKLMWLPPSELGYGTRGLSLAEKPCRVWTLFRNLVESGKPELPFKPHHNVNAFLEDQGHDWSWREATRHMGYFSRIVEHTQGVWLLIEYADE